MPRTGGFKPPLRIMALSKRHSESPAFQAISPVQKSAVLLLSFGIRGAGCQQVRKCVFDCFCLS
jgi:hypothetical protein